MTRKHKPQPDREEIVRLIGIKGEFRVHKYRTREMPLRTKCRKMVLDGLIVEIGNRTDELIYTTLEIAQKLQALHTSALSAETDHEKHHPS